MKRATIIAVAAIILSIPLTGSVQTCSSTINLSVVPDILKVNAIKNALISYSSYPEADHYEGHL